MRRNTIIAVLIVTIMLATPGTVLLRSFGENEVKIPARAQNGDVEGEAHY